MSIELFIEYYQQMQEILTNNIFQEYGIIGLFLNSLLAATAIPLPTEILTSALLIGGENIFLVAIVLIIGSVIGGILNYFIGLGGNKLVKKMKKKSDIEKHEKKHISVYYTSIIFYSFVLFTFLSYKIATQQPRCMHKTGTQKVR